jgi:2-keto-4-pentenoate hydratase/2-oxohepta-3-ene-1,7-dioic acid hydratase in catechol pathway
MKLLRYSSGGKSFLGVVKGDAIVNLEPLGYPTMLALIQSGGDSLAGVRELMASASPHLEIKQARLLAPIERPGKYLAIGMNYRKHAEEARRLGISIPEKQLWFNKQTSCLAGPFDVIDPGVTEKLDYEVELGVVIGPRPAKRVSEADASKFVFGYFVANDVSARDWQMHTPTFTVGKSFDTHGPIGPWIVTADEVSDPHNLAVRCLVNGERRQQSNTSEMIFNIWQQIAYLSTAFTLEAGDLLATGTPEGIGAGMSPPRFMQPGDVVRCEIDGIGVIENRVATAELSTPTCNPT